jgi:hypothetical protein
LLVTFDHSFYSKFFKLLFILFVTYFIIYGTLNTTFSFFIFTKIIWIRWVIKRYNQKLKISYIVGWREEQWYCTTGSITQKTQKLASIIVPARARTRPHLFRAYAALCRRPRLPATRRGIRRRLSASPCTRARGAPGQYQREGRNAPWPRAWNSQRRWVKGKRCISAQQQPSCQCRRLHGSRSRGSDARRGGCQRASALAFVAACSEPPLPRFLCVRFSNY